MVSIGTSTVIDAETVPLKRKRYTIAEPDLTLLPELDLFERESVNHQIKNSFFVPVNTQNLLDKNSGRGDGTLVFKFYGDDYFISLRDCFIHLEVKITHPDTPEGSLLDFSKAKVGPVNSFSTSIIRNMKCTLDTTVVSASYNTYAYTQYFLNLLTTDRETRITKVGGSMCWAGDTPGSFDALITGGDVRKTPSPGGGESTSIAPLISHNKGLESRRSMFNSKGRIELVVPLNIDLARQKKLLLNKVNLEVELALQKPEFCLMCQEAEKYNFEVIRATLYILKVELAEAPNLALESVLKDYKTVYEFEQNITRILHLAKGQRYYTFDPLFAGILPTRCILGLVKETAATGNYTQNPFNFEHHDVESVTCYLSGKAYPFIEQKFNFEDNDCLLAFLNLYRDTGCDFYNNHTLGITLNQFKRGTTLFSFNFTPHILSVNQLRAEPVQGPFRIDFRFRTTVYDSLSAIMFLVFPARAEISKFRSVSVTQMGKKPNI